MAEETEDLILEGEELTAEGPVVESGVGRVIVPQKGKLFAEDGSVTAAIIRSCMSRGKRIRGLAPIYENVMLGRNDSVFQDWHMWMGHMSVPLREALEELEEQLQEAVTPRRLFSELGGRITKTWHDPNHRAKGDDENGYRPGAIMGKLIPYPASKQILEADPDGLHISIAAWPTGARKASPSWDKSVTGMAIEGFRRTPRGSVDWVLRGGAGGRPLAEGLSEEEALAVYSLGELYASAMPESPFKDMTLEKLREQVRKDNPALAVELGLEESAAGGGAPTPVVPATAPAAQPTLTQADLDKALSEQRTVLTAEFTTKLAESEEAAEDAVSDALSEARAAESNERMARLMITKSGLPVVWQEKLLEHYTVSSDGVPESLLSEEEVNTEGVTVSASDVFQGRVKESIEESRKLIEASGGSPRVTGLGGAGRQLSQKKQKANSAFRDFLSESGDNLGEKPDETIKTMVQEGIA